MRCVRAVPAFIAGALAVLPAVSVAQEPPTPAPPSEQLPPVDVIQKQATPAPAAKQKSAAKKKQAPVSPVPQPPPAVATTPEAQEPNSVYGAARSGGAAARAANGVTEPINPTQLIPTNLGNFSSAATNLTSEQLTEREPRNVNEALTRVPGVIVINDDGNGHHGGIGVRGSPPRRTRKVLYMEDGHPLNLALWLDPSVHYATPLDRVESIEVLKGTVIAHGPNNNFGVINLRALSPFGPDETVISSAIGFTDMRGGCYDGDCKPGSTEESYRWHVHTRQSSGNVGVVFSYTGADVQGAWDTERLRFNDYHGAIGWKGVDQDLTVSVTHARQRDLYDESNLAGEDGDPPGEVENAFFEVGDCKTCFAPGAVFNNYNGEVWRGQAVRNYYVDANTTVTSRVYAQEHRRDRYQIATLEDDPTDPAAPGLPAGFGTGGGSEDDSVYFAEGTMFGRLRTFRHLGGEVRAEFANTPLAGGVTQDIQVGLRYEYQDMTNRNFLGSSGEILEDGDTSGLTIFERNLQANTVSAFMQTDIKATRNFHVVPGVRFEWYGVNRDSMVTAEEEGEAEEAETPAQEAECLDAIGITDDCMIIEGIERDVYSEKYDSFNVLPGIAFAYNGFYKTTVFGGYHRGMTTAVLRNENFPSPDEIGDNFQIGVRSSAITGVAFEVAAFHQRLQDFQYGDSFGTGSDRSFGRADEVHINGIEMFGRLNSKPFVGGPLNFFGEANYTYNRAIIEQGVNSDGDDLAGNQVPEVPFHIAAMTLGVENFAGWRWDASVTYTYRGWFYTDAENTPYGGDPEGEDGMVPEVWLLSARFNMDIGNTGASVFVAGDNLTNELYITDREDGLKPGIGRTVWTGFKYRF
jgi:Fe(3+) dicitrate transport protein